MTMNLAKHRLLTGPEVAELFRVSPSTVSRWADEDKLPFVRATDTSHRRYRWEDVARLLESRVN